jgi:pimeloyl-ACP methyl ester carboxylesterase
MMMQSSFRAAAEMQRALGGTDLRNDLQTIDVPVMIIHGTADASIPIAFGRRTTKYLRDWRMIEYEGAPHGLLVTHAERLTKDIAEFAASWATITSTNENRPSAMQAGGLFAG